MSVAGYSRAVMDFRRARRRAALRDAIARFTGKSTRLLSYEEVRRKLRATETSRTELREIPLDGIVGSVGRFDDFTRGFLPRRDSDEARWAGVKVAVTELSGLPPIDVYQIGDAYFVLDGNHRVSVARDLGASHIQAYVRPVQTKVPLAPDVQPDDLIVKGEFVEFSQLTGFDEILPEADLTVTLPGRYPVLMAQIFEQRDRISTEERREVSLAEAVRTWYEQLYLPTVRLIRDRGLLREFAGRTEADLYVWILQHKAELERELGWEINQEAAAFDAADQSSPGLNRRISQFKEKLFDALTPDALQEGPSPGAWRQMQLGVRRRTDLLADILVAVGTDESRWNAVDQALIIAQREEARLHGLHVVESDNLQRTKEVGAIKSDFERRVSEAGISGELVVAAGEIDDEICDRARWADIVVVSLSHPPGTRPLTRLGSGFRNLILCCPAPMLAVPGTARPMEAALLAYDGSPKSKEALYLSTYLASRWRISLTVASVLEADNVTENTLSEARSYAEQCGVTLSAISTRGDVIEGIMRAADDHGCDFIVMGGYGHSPILEAALGSTVDHVLRQCKYPVLLCR